jgi:hypothetical protein
MAGMVALAASVVVALFAMYQAFMAWRSAQRAAQVQLYAAFDFANRALLDHPELLHAAHGLDESVPREEALAIAYLACILDGFQHYSGGKHAGRFDRMARRMMRRSTFLNCVLREPANQRRWQAIKRMNYGERDRGFVDAIDALIEFERARVPRWRPSAPPAPGRPVR